ncbi:MAG: ABC transporter substrate-binding protein [Candidatus Bathyarchaeia archaeon]
MSTKKAIAKMHAAVIAIIIIIAVIAGVAYYYTTLPGPTPTPATPTPKTPTPATPTPATPTPATPTPATPTPATPTPATPTPTPTPSVPIKIGVVGELTGPWAYSGTGQLEGLNFAVEKINKMGGVLGRRIELVVTDSKSDTSEAITLFRRLVEVDKVSAVIGGVSSSVAISLSAEAEKAKVPTIMSWAASERVHTKNSSYIFRSPVQLTPPVMQGVTEYIKSKGYKRVGMLIADYAFGRSVEANLKKFLEAIPGAQVTVEAAPVGETDFTSYIRKLQAFNPEILVNGHPPGGASAVKQMIEMGMEVEVIIAYAPDWTELWGALREDAFRIRVIHVWGSFDPSNPDYIKVAEEFREKVGKFMDISQVVGYIQVNLLAEAIKNANSAEPEKIRTALSQISYRSFIAFPMSYTPWGEFKEQRIVLTVFKPGPPPGNVNPLAAWHPEAIYISPPLEPYVPAA